MYSIRFVVFDDIIICLGRINSIEHTQEEVFSLVGLTSSFLLLGGGVRMPNVYTAMLQMRLTSEGKCKK